MTSLVAPCVTQRRISLFAPPFVEGSRMHHCVLMRAGALWSGDVWIAGGTVAGVRLTAEVGRTSGGFVLREARGRLDADQPPNVLEALRQWASRLRPVPPPGHVLPPR